MQQHFGLNSGGLSPMMNAAFWSQFVLPEFSQKTGDID
jgi:hypothetical protein